MPKYAREIVIRVFQKIHGQKTGYSWPQATAAA